MARQNSVDNAHNIAGNQKKDDVEQHGGPLRKSPHLATDQPNTDRSVPDFPVGDELKQTETMNETILNARKATEAEHKMTLMQGVRLYPKAILWSMLISTCIVMEGFDVALVNNVRSLSIHARPQYD
jgi:hypothetical protein